MRRARRSVAALVAGSVALSSGRAHADQEKLLLVQVPVAEGGWPEAERRAYAELLALDLDVALSAGPPLSRCSDDPETRLALQTRDAFGAVEIRRIGGTSNVRVCVVDRVTGKATLRHLPASAALNAEQSALLAVEVVYASFLEVRASHPSRGEVSPPPAVRRNLERQLPEREPRFSARAGAIIAGGPGGVTPSIGVMLGAGVRLSQHSHLDGDAFTAMLAGAAESEVGTADVPLGAVRLHLLYSVVDDTSWRVHVGLGGGALAASISGTASSPYRSSNGFATTWLTSGAIGSAYALSPALALRVDVHVGFTAAPLEVRFADGHTARSGAPLFDGALALEWRGP